MATAPELLPDARSDTREGGVALESPPPDGFLWRQLAASGLGAVAEKVAAGQDLELDEVLLLSRASLPLLGNLVQLRETVLSTLRPDVPISPSAALPIDRAASLPDSPRRIGQAPADWELFCRTLIDLRGEISPIEAPMFWYPIVEQSVDQDHELEGGFSGVEVLRAIALARLVLPAEVDVWAPLATLGPKLAQVALDFGASHLGCVAPDGQAPRHPLVADPSVFDELLRELHANLTIMNIDPKLREIADKAEAGERLGLDDGMLLSTHPDVLTVGQIANAARERLHGNVTYYNRNLHLNATNVCEASCAFCSFARLKEGMPSAYTMSPEQALEWIEKRYQPGMTEVHIVNGLNPALPFSYYTDLLRTIRTRFPALHLKAFTAVEIHYFAQKFGFSYRQVLEQLVDAGLGSLPGGGAEIFAARVRKRICRDKVDAEGWLDIHRTAHHLGLKSNCTMLYGTIETREERIDHLLRLRDLQDETGGFQAFVPLAYHPDGNRLRKLGAPTADDDLRMIAVSRLMLDNIPHIKAYWIMLGLKMAQVAQRFGANDMDGTVIEEKIYHMAGAETPHELTIDELGRMIRAMGREPVERTTVYETVCPATNH